MTLLLYYGTGVWLLHHVGCCCHCCSALPEVQLHAGLRHNISSPLRLTPPKLGHLIMTVFSQTGDNDAGLGDWMVEILIWHAVIFALVFCGTSTGSLLLLLSRAVFNYDLGCFRLIWHLYHHEYGSCKPVHRSWHRIQGDNWIFKVVTSWYWFRWFLELKDLMEPGENLSAWGRVMCPRLIFKTM